MALLDASPKGATFRNYGDSEAQFIADEAHLNCQACGGSGHIEDSPKGGSEAAKPYQVPPLCDFCRKRPGQHSNVDGVRFCQPCGEEWRKADAQAQAGDAEVQP